MGDKNLLDKLEEFEKKMEKKRAECEKNGHLKPVLIQGGFTKDEYFCKHCGRSYDVYLGDEERRGREDLWHTPLCSNLEKERDFCEYLIF